MQLSNIRAIGVTESFLDFQKVLELNKLYPELYYPFVGIHPIQNQRSVQKSDLDCAFAKIEDLLNQRIVKGVGEIGLDYSPHVLVNQEDKQEQIYVFKKQLELALQHNVYVNVHSRQAGHYVIEIMQEMGIKKAIMHAFDGKSKYAVEAVKNNPDWFFSIPGSVLRNSQFQKLVKQLPLANILLESDSPALCYNSSEKSNPTHISKVAEYISNIKGISLDELKIKLLENVERVLDLH